MFLPLDTALPCYQDAGDSGLAEIRNGRKGKDPEFPQRALVRVWKGLFKVYSST